MKPKVAPNLSYRVAIVEVRHRNCVVSETNFPVPNILK